MGLGVLGKLLAPEITAVALEPYDGVPDACRGDDCKLLDRELRGLGQGLRDPYDPSVDTFPIMLELREEFLYIVESHLHSYLLSQKGLTATKG
jgi:hypothetical protein